MRTAILAAVLVAALRAESTSEHSFEVAWLPMGVVRGVYLLRSWRSGWILCWHRETTRRALVVLLAEPMRESSEKTMGA